MKKNVFRFSILVFVMALFVTNCQSDKKETNSRPVTSKQTICSDYSSAKVSELPIGLIQDMIAGYGNNQLEAINDGLKLNDARAISFDLETLKKFIYHIEAISKSQSSSLTDEDLGIRIYYSAYPDKSRWSDARYNGALDLFMGDPITEQYGNLHTLLILPTIKRGDTYYDFNPRDRSTYEAGLPSVFRQNQNANYYSNPQTPLMSLSMVSKSSSGSRPGSGTISQNHGGLFPPHTDNGLGF